MSGRVEIPVVTAGWESVETTLAQLRTGGEEFEQFINEQLDELFRLNQHLDARRQQLDQKERGIHSQREQAERDTSRESELIAHLEQAHAELTAARTELDQVQTSAEELTDAHAELAAARVELAERKRMSAAGGHPGDDDARQRLSEIERERTALESELEQVRYRAAEAADALDEQKRRAAEERAEWSGELKQMRVTLERQSQLLADRQNTVTAVAPPAKVNVRHAEDPVVDSVMAQFETLQKDLIRRRKQKGRPGKSGVA